MKASCGKDPSMGRQQACRALVVDASACEWSGKSSEKLLNCNCKQVTNLQIGVLSIQVASKFLHLLTDKTGAADKEGERNR